MNNYDEARLNAIKKFDYVVRVLNSCKTYEQIYNVQKWGTKVINKSFKYDNFLPFMGKIEMDGLKHVYLLSFLEKLKDKRKEVYNGKI